MKRCLAACLLAGCQLAFPLDPASRTQTIELHPPTQAPLLGFPASIVITGEPALAATDGSDLRFVADDGTELVHEVVAFDPMAGDLEAWVLLPELDPGGTTIELRYGDRQAASAAGSVWPPPYAGVWHLAEATGARDSTMLGHDLGGANEPASAPGIAGAGRAFDGSGQSMCALAADVEITTGSFTYSAWVNVTASAGDADMPLFHGGSSAGTAGYDFELGTGPWKADIADDDSLEQATFVEDQDASVLGRWVHLTAVVDRDAKLLRTYTDGRSFDSVAIPDIASVGSNQGLVTCLGGTRPFAGVLDEVRILSTAVSDDWVLAERANLADRDAFVQVGPPTPR